MTRLKKLEDNIFVKIVFYWLKFHLLKHELLYIIIFHVNWCVTFRLFLLVRLPLPAAENFAYPSTRSNRLSKQIFDNNFSRVTLSPLNLCWKTHTKKNGKLKSLCFAFAKSPITYNITTNMGSWLGDNVWKNLLGKLFEKSENHLHFSVGTQRFVSADICSERPK